MQRIIVLIYGLLAFAAFGAISVYTAAFVGGFWLPNTLDSATSSPLWQALLINFGVIIIFGLQHSVMARPAFKRWWTQYIPEEAERSTYVLLSCVALAVVYLFWQPMGGVIWSIDATWGKVIMWSLYSVGWLLLLASAASINLFHLFGLSQVWAHFKGTTVPEPEFQQPWLYRQVRHPLYTAWLMIFWATPHMTIAHLVFAVGLTAYILIAIRYEERDLIALHGENYRNYRDYTPALIPRLLPRRKTQFVFEG